MNISQSEDELQAALYLHGPVSVAYNAMDSFVLYESGIYSAPDCGSTPADVNHAVVAVGWGTEKGMDYWIIKNSWSPYWGEDGYFRIQRGVNMCGINNCNSYPYDIVDVAENITE